MISILFIHSQQATKQTNKNSKKFQSIFGTSFNVFPIINHHVMSMKCAMKENVCQIQNNFYLLLTKKNQLTKVIKK